MNSLASHWLVFRWRFFFVIRRSAPWDSVLWLGLSGSRAAHRGTMWDGGQLMWRGGVEEMKCVEFFTDVCFLSFTCKLKARFDRIPRQWKRKIQMSQVDYLVFCSFCTGCLSLASFPISSLTILHSSYCPQEHSHKLAIRASWQIHFVCSQVWLNFKAAVSMGVLL